MGMFWFSTGSYRSVPDESIYHYSQPKPLVTIDELQCDLSTKNDQSNKRTLFRLLNDIIRVIKSLKNSSVSIDGVNETIKHEIKKTRRWIYQYVARNFKCIKVF